MVEPSLLERMEVGAVLYAVLKNLNGIRKLRNMKDDRYTTERITDKNGKLLMVRVTMKAYKEWIEENGEAQVFHKTDTAGFKSPLVKEDYE